MQFEKTETYQNLARSFAGECQAGMRYQMIAKLAMQEKMKTLADAVRTIAKNETVHATQFFTGRPNGRRPARLSDPPLSSPAGDRIRLRGDSKDLAPALLLRL